jgi:hypothetical protein
LGFEIGELIGKWGGFGVQAMTLKKDSNGIHLKFHGNLEISPKGLFKGTL